MNQKSKHSYKVSAPDGLPLVVYNVGFQKCDALHSWGPGVRDHFLLHHIVSGRGVYQRGSDRFSLSAGQSFLIYPGEEVYYAADQSDPWEYYWAGFSGGGAVVLLSHTSFSADLPVLFHPISGLRQGLLEVYKARGSDFASAVRMAGYLQAALGLLIGSEMPLLEDYTLRGARLIEYNYARPITIEEVARQVGVSRSQLYRGFIERFGVSPKEYLGQVRFDQARLLLERGDLSVGAVARSIGIDDPLYFSRIFHRETGFTPVEYRRSFDLGN